MAVLVTGAAGYIGSHTCVELLNADYSIVAVDNFSNSHIESLNRVKELTQKDFPIYEVDILDYSNLNQLFNEHNIEAVIHFAALKAVGESVEKPLEYYKNNVGGTLSLLENMKANNVKNIIFSSSATVYGDPSQLPITETFPTQTTNPYGASKLMIEDILKDLSLSDASWNISLLRYFNPIGAHQSGEIGESPNGIPNNLFPYISQVAVGKLEKLKVFGSDYETTDGTGVRDYIHVVDLAKGHVKALDKVKEDSGLTIYNLGTGVGYSVLEAIHAFEEACGKPVPYDIVDRRPGDIASCYADATKAKQELDWVAEFGIERMAEDTWRWQSKYPNGYDE